MTESFKAKLELVLTEVDSAAATTRQLIRSATAGQLAGDSPLPGWTRAHVVAHICGFSHGMARQWEYALRGDLIEQYDGGMDGRNADIEALAAKDADELKAATDDALDRLKGAAEAMTEQDWLLPISYRQGDAFGGLEAAWRELAIHLTDLDLGPKQSGWSPAFCEHLFEFLGPRVPEGTTLVLRPRDAAAVTLGEGGNAQEVTGTLQDLAAWLAGRNPEGELAFAGGRAPELGPWPARKN